jgi:hypothetical protein
MSGKLLQSEQRVVSERAYLDALRRWQDLTDKVFELLADGDVRGLIVYAADVAGGCDYWDDDLDALYLNALERWPTDAPD